MNKANGAQVLAGFIWKNELPKSVFMGTIENGFEVNQVILLQYLMDFQEFLYKGQKENEFLYGEVEHK